MRLRATLAATVLATTTLALTPTPTYAATIAVTTTADELDTNGKCSLREAIRAANLNKRVGACAAGSATGLDTITVPAGTYVLTRAGADEDAAATGDLDLIGSVKIAGADATTTIIDGNATDRVLDVRSGGQLTLASITLRNGDAVQQGAGIRNNGSVSATNVTVAQNINWNYGDPNEQGGGLYNAAGRTASFTTSVFADNRATLGGAIYNLGTVNLTTTSVERNQAGENGAGGGIYSTGTLTVLNSTLRENRANDGPGGGIDNRGSATITHSTISGGYALYWGGGISNSGTLRVIRSTLSGNGALDGGGGLVNLVNGSATLRNTTISGNTAEYSTGGISNGGTLLLSNSTVTNNTGETGGIASAGGTTTLANTIIAGNSTTTTQDPQPHQVPDCFGTLTSNGYNLIGTTSGCTITGTTTGNQLDVAANLGPLQHNGGATWTHAPQPGSPAIDAGSPATSGSSVCQQLDQRELPRPKDGNGDGQARCDIGAVERQSVSTP